MDVYYSEAYTSLWCSQLDEPTKRKHGGYTFLVTAGSFSHTAFYKVNSLLSWLKERGLKLTHPLVELGEYDSQRIIGDYIRRAWIVPDLFYELEYSGNYLYKIAEMNNGDYTLGIVTVENGIHVVNYINVNYPHITLDWETTNFTHR